MDGTTLYQQNLFASLRSVSLEMRSFSTSGKQSYTKTEGSRFSGIFVFCSFYRQRRTNSPLLYNTHNWARIPRNHCRSRVTWWSVLARACEVRGCRTRRGVYAYYADADVAEKLQYNVHVAMNLILFRCLIGYFMNTLCKRVSLIWMIHDVK